MALAPVSQLIFIGTGKSRFEFLFGTVCVNDNLRALRVPLYYQ